jgi:hypothetical protein
MAIEYMWPQHIISVLSSYAIADALDTRGKDQIGIGESATRRVVIFGAFRAKSILE